MRKNFVVDTNVLLNNPESIIILRNGIENNIYLPKHVLYELDKLKSKSHLRPIINTVIDTITNNYDWLNFLDCFHIDLNFADDNIVKEIKTSNIEDPILVTNDKMLRLKCKTYYNIKTEEFQDSKPFKTESEIYMGFDDSDVNPISNSFTWINGTPQLNLPKNNKKLIEYTHNVWKVKPRTVYQNLMIELILSEHIDLVSVQSVAGLGKSFIALTCAMHLILQEKKYNKLFITKSTFEKEQSLGFLPGDVDDKIGPFYEYLNDLILKLHNIRPCNRFYRDPANLDQGFNKHKLEILPYQYIKGRNLENCIVIIDEVQDLSRDGIRSLLTRMGTNCKCICIGDVHQIDNPILNKYNNGLNWIVKCFKGQNNYAHINLKGQKSRGPICDLVINNNL
jgi:PhoH-like ATPase